MKVEIITLQDGAEERATVYLTKNNPNRQRITAFFDELLEEIFAYKNKEIFKLSHDEIFAVAIEKGKTFVIRESDKLEVKERLYVLEESLGASFIKINQSCLINISKIKKFDASISGAFVVILKNGFRDYVSRRQVSYVKERLGLKK